MYPALEHRRLAGRAQALAVHHAHAAQAVFVRLADELAQRLARFIDAQAVQVKLILDAPMARAQAPRDLDADACASVAQLVVGVEQGADVKVVADRLEQRALRVPAPAAGATAAPARPATGGR